VTAKVDSTKLAISYMNDADRFVELVLALMKEKTGGGGGGDILESSSETPFLV
jgi:hypothetical protein